MMETRFFTGIFDSEQLQAIFDKYPDSHIELRDFNTHCTKPVYVGTRHEFGVRFSLHRGNIQFSQECFAEVGKHAQYCGPFVWADAPIPATAIYGARCPSCDEYYPTPR